MKKCSKCGKLKELSEFRVDNSRKDGHKCACKECMRIGADKPAEPLNVGDTKSIGVSVNEKGDKTFDDIMSLYEGEAITPEMIMEAHNLNTDEWVIVSFRSNVWQSQVKGGDKINLWQSKLTVKPIDGNALTFKVVDEYFKDKIYPSVPKVSYNYTPKGEVLEINYVDAHNGLLCWDKETGANFDTKIAREYFLRAIGDVRERCDGRKLKKIIFTTLGDLLHTDNDLQTTTKGTFQQVEGRLPKIFNGTCDTMIDVLKTLADIAPIEVIYLPGNHDRILGYTCMHSVSKALPWMDIDIMPNPMKHRVVTNNALVGWHHGDMPKKLEGDWLSVVARQIGGIKFCEVHSGHLHSEWVRRENSVTVRHLSSICESSYYEHQQGYANNKAFMCFLWSENNGLRESWINNI